MGTPYLSISQIEVVYKRCHDLCLVYIVTKGAAVSILKDAREAVRTGQIRSVLEKQALFR